MKKYIVVLHKWFVDSKGFEVKEIEANSYKEANAQAKILCFDATYSMTYCAYKLIELEKDMVIKKKTGSLSWMERLTGRVEETENVNNENAGQKECTDKDSI